MSAVTDAYTQLLRSQKPNRGAPPYSRWINRPLGRLFASVAYVCRLTPNQVTVLSAISSFTGLIALALIAPRWWLGIAVGILLILGYALDAADGQLARLQGGGSVAGEWLDHVVDVTKICVLHAVVAVSIYRFGPRDGALLLVPLAYEAVACVFFFSFILVDKLRREHNPKGSAAPNTGAGLFQTLVALPTDYGFLCLTFVLFGWRSGFLILYSTMFATNAIVLIGVLAKWWFEMRSLDKTIANARHDQ